MMQLKLNLRIWILGMVMSEGWFLLYQMTMRCHKPNTQMRRAVQDCKASYCAWQVVSISTAVCLYVGDKLLDLTKANNCIKVGCAGAILTHLQRRRATEYLPGDEMANVAFRIRTLKMFVLDDVM